MKIYPQVTDNLGLSTWHDKAHKLIDYHQIEDTKFDS